MGAIHRVKRSVSTRDHSEAPKEQPLRIKRTSKRPIKRILIGVAGIIVLMVIMAIRFILAPVHISDPQIRRVDENRDVSVSQAIREGERLVVTFAFSRAKPALPLNVEVVRNGAVVRIHALSALRTDEKSASSGTRSVVIVKSSSDKLVAGDYEVRITTLDGDMLTKKRFTIVK